MVKCTSENKFTPDENEYFDGEAVMNTIHHGDYFSIDELEGIIKSCPNGKSCGVQGVFYEDLKKMCPGCRHILTNVLNIMLINQIISTSWEHSVIQRFNVSQKTILLRKIYQCYVIFPITDLLQDSMKSSL